MWTYALKAMISCKQAGVGMDVHWYKPVVTVLQTARSNKPE